MTDAAPGDVRALTFDFYDTLVHHRTGRGRGREVVDYLVGHGLEPEPWKHSFLYDLFEPHPQAYPLHGSEHDKRDFRVGLAGRVFERLGVRAPDGAAAEHADGLWARLGPASFEVFPEVGEVLGRLRDAGLPLAVVSNWQRGLSHFVHELGLAPFFDHVLSSAEVGSQKPAPGIFDEACRRLVLHVGDTVVDDVEGATSAGVAVALVVREGDIPKVDVPTIRDLRGMLGLAGLSVD